LTERLHLLVRGQSYYTTSTKTGSENSKPRDSDRIDEESWEVCDSLPFGVDQRRVSVEDDITQTVCEERTGPQRSDEVDQTNLMRVATSTQYEDNVL